MNYRFLFLVMSDADIENPGELKKTKNLAYHSFTNRVPVS